MQRKPGETDTSLDENIWEFEWKRLEKHSKKILAPVILLGNNSLIYSVAKQIIKSEWPILFKTFYTPFFPSPAFYYFMYYIYSTTSVNRLVGITYFQKISKWFCKSLIFDYWVVVFLRIFSRYIKVRTNWTRGLSTPRYLKQIGR